MALDTAAAARISPDAHTVRYCWRLSWAMTDGILYAVMAISVAERLNSITSLILVESCRWDLMTMGSGNTMRRMSVIMSAVPIVMSCTYACRHCGPGSGTTCQ